MFDQEKFITYPKLKGYLNPISKANYRKMLPVHLKNSDEDAHTVKGLHQGIISESLFYDVQHALNGNKKAEKTKIHSPEMLPLRGFIRCSKCSRILCVSASKGRNGYYYYYHCSSACGCRYKAKEVNELFIDQLQQYTVRPEYAELFTEVISDSYNSQHSSQRDNRSELLKEINKLSDKLSKARELLLNGNIDGSDYRTIKIKNEGKIEILEAKLAETMSNKTQVEDITPLLTKAIARLTELGAIYSKSETSEKREIIGSMYPEKFTFEELQHRTAQVGELYSCIYLINSKLSGKKRASDRIFVLAHCGS